MFCVPNADAMATGVWSSSVGVSISPNITMPVVPFEALQNLLLGVPTRLPSLFRPYRFRPRAPKDKPDTLGTQDGSKSSSGLENLDHWGA
jgi:hypothetical protein